MVAKVTRTGPGALLARLFRLDRNNITPSTAKFLLSLGFDESDKARMHQLAVHNQAGLLSSSERDELFAYIDLCDLLTLLHSRARQVLKKSKKKKA